MKRLLGLSLMLAAVCASAWLVWSFGRGLDVERQEEAVVGLVSVDIVPVEVIESDLMEFAGEELVDPFESVSAGEKVAVMGSVGDARAVLYMPSLQQVLPVYLGATYQHLYSATAFVAGADLPTVTGGTRVVIAGHRGYYGQLLFLNLNSLSVGVPVFIYFNGQMYEYLVMSQAVVTANDATALLPVAGEIWLTLLTCTPIPTFEKRLLVNAKLVGVTDVVAGVGELRLVTNDVENLEVADVDEDEGAVVEIDIGADSVVVNSVTEIAEEDLLEVVQRVRKDVVVEATVLKVWTAYPFVMLLLILVALILSVKLVKLVIRMVVKN